MTTALNFTLKIKQTPEVLAKLQKIKESFASAIQPEMEAALRESQIVHYARVLIIDDLYIQVITEFDGDERVYAEFFRKKLLHLFLVVFSLSENPPTPEQMEDPNTFADFTTNLNLPSLGTDGLDHQGTEKDKGYFFQAYPSVLVKDVLTAFPPTPV